MAESVEITTFSRLALKMRMVKNCTAIRLENSQNRMSTRFLRCIVKIMKNLDLNVFPITCCETSQDSAYALKQRIAAVFRPDLHILLIDMLSVSVPFDVFSWIADLLDIPIKRLQCDLILFVYRGILEYAVDQVFREVVAAVRTALPAPGILLICGSGQNMELLIPEFTGCGIYER